MRSANKIESISRSTIRIQTYNITKIATFVILCYDNFVRAIADNVRLHALHHFVKVKYCSTSTSEVNKRLQLSAKVRETSKCEQIRSSL